MQMTEQPIVGRFHLRESLMILVSANMMRSVPTKQKLALTAFRNTCKLDRVRAWQQGGCETILVNQDKACTHCTVQMKQPARVSPCLIERLTHSRC